MCWFKKEDYLIWVNVDGYDQRLMLRLQTTADKRAYNDYFTIERPLRGGQGTEILFTLPFRTIMSISYLRATASEPYTICFEMVGGDPCLSEIKVEKHCFNYLGFKKMVKIHKKSGQAMGL